jgi:hypothetical protein
LEEKIKDLKEIYEEREKNPEVQKMDSLLPVQKNLSVAFNKHRSELVSIIECVTQIACFIFVITFFIRAILMRYINSLSSLIFNRTIV